MRERASITPEIASAAARWVARRDAGLGVQEKDEFERWLAADFRHASAMTHFSEVLAAFERPQRAGIAPVVIREMQARAQRRRRRRLKAVSAAAALIIMTCSIGWWLDLQRAPQSIAQVPASAVAFQPERRVLSDGSVVELRDNAKILVNFEPSLRRVELQVGEAHFEIAKDAERPFIVKAGGVEVRAVGTAFSVQLGARAVEVLVTEGRVAMDTVTGRSAPSQPLSAAQNDSPEVSELYIDAGNRVVVEVAPESTPAPTVMAVSQNELAERLAWRSPRLEFSGTPLGEAVALMNRSIGAQGDSTRLRLVIDPGSRKLMEEPVSGTFRADNPEAFARMLEMSLGVQIERRGDYEIVLRK